MTEAVKMTEEEQQQWVKKQYQIATKYLAEKGIVTKSVIVEESRYIIPLLAIWKLTSMDDKRYWVLSGDLPSDHSTVGVAPNAREALRHFSLKWQMQAENLLRSKNEEQTIFANLLIKRAEDFYKLSNDDVLWQSE